MNSKHKPEYKVFKDGDMFFASNGDFKNLQESHVEFAETPALALNLYCQWELRAEQRARIK